MAQGAAHRRLKFAYSRHRDLGAVVNLDIDGAVWRWIGGFHAALSSKLPHQRAEGPSADAPGTARSALPDSLRVRLPFIFLKEFRITRLA